MIYAVNKETKEHRFSEHSMGDSDEWEFVPCDADGWIEWKGGECPLPDKTPFECKDLRGKRHILDRPEVHQSFWKHTSSYVLEHIIAYRPILEPQAEPVKGWDGEGLPPVGTVCEWSDNERDARRVVVMGYYEDSVWLRIVDGNTPITVHCIASAFRPLRTDRERWIDIAARVPKPCGYPIIPILEQIYDAGLARLPD